MPHGYYQMLMEFTTDAMLFVIQTMLCVLLFLVVERIRPIQNIPLVNKEKIAEFSLMVVNTIFLQPFFYFVVLIAFTHTLKELIPHQIFDAQIQNFPYILQILLGALLLDLKVYIRHRFTHNFMWRTHAVHHSATDISWLTGFRLHPSELLIDVIFTVPFMHVLGFSGESIAQATLIMFAFNLFTHTNINLEYPGLLRYIIGSPNVHRWHHAKLEKQAYDKNFSVIFPFIDLAFGSFYHPKGKLPQEYGVLSEAPINHSLRGYLGYPFRKI